MPRTKGNIRRRESGNYQVNWLDASNKRRFRTFRTKKAAEQFLRAEQAEVDAIRAGLTAGIVTTKRWEDLVELWSRKKAHKRSLRDDQGRIRCHLTPELEGRLLVEIGPAVVTRLEEALRRKVSGGELAQSTARKVLILFGAMMKVAVREHWLGHAPVLELPPEGERDFQWIRTAHEMRRLIEAARGEDYPGLPEFYATALYTGLRAGELCGLRWPDVDLTGALITVQRSFQNPTKNNRVRRVPISTPLEAMLRAYQGNCLSTEIVFPNLRGNPHQPSARVMDEVFKRCLERAEVPRMTFHALRHTYASHFVLNGGDIYRLQRILGHSSVKVTQRYAHLAPDALRADRDRLPNLL